MTIEELGRRAVACKHWRWMPGMLVDGIRIDGTCHFVGGLGKPWREEDFREVICDECVPDLSDPATIGCLLALVREAWTRDPEVNHWVSYAVPVFDGLETWRVGCILDGAKMFAVCNLATMTLVEGKTEAEALVAALEAAP
jgi:hypothetical protein